MGDRRTFVVHVHMGGPATLEDVRTGRTVALAELAAVGDQITEWLAGDGVAAASELLAGDDPGLQA